MLTSISLTERVKLWNKFNGPIDQDSIKLEFFRRVHSKNPPFRFKIKLPPRNRIKVPPMVKDHYKKPVQLLPSLRDVLRLETVLKRDDKNISQVDIVKTEEIDEQVQTSVDKNSNGNNYCNGPDSKIDCDRKLDRNTQESVDEDDTKNDFIHKNGCIKNEFINGVAVDQKDNVFLPDVISDISSEGKIT